MKVSHTQERRVKVVRELRATIEAFASRYAASEANAGVSTEPLKQAFQRLREACKNGDHHSVPHWDREFHRAILKLADVEGLIESWELVHQHEAKFHTQTIENCWPDLNQLLDLHQPILDAICASDATAAENATHNHIEVIWYHITRSENGITIRYDPLAAACAHLARHLHEPIRLSLVASQVSRTSASHLARLFRQKYEMSFTDYLRELRMRRAAELLTNTTQPIRDIGTKVGYKDASRFAQHFKRRFEVPPRVYRKRFTDKRNHL